MRGNEDGAEDGLPDELQPLFERVRRATGHDFAGYKPSTIGRRLRRRMTTLEVPTLADYLARLDGDPEEPAQLVRELLVSVTSFFREPGALEAAAELAPRPPAGQPLRVWVPGCATGEEAYSLAIALRERFAGPMVVFATDLDAAAVERARAGHYPAAIADQISSERLARHFVATAEGFQIAPALRETCVFSPHNVLHDPPFARLHLVSCRNLLIYLEPELQRRLVAMFHYALAPGGVLVLGEAETVGPDGPFEPVAHDHRVYRRHEPAAGRAVSWFPSSGGARLPSTPPAVVPPSAALTTRMLERALLDEHAPPGAVVTEAGEVLYVCGRAEPFLESPRGSAPFDLLTLVRPALRQEVRAALTLAVSSGHEVTSPMVTLPLQDGERAVQATVRPMRDVSPIAPPYLVTFGTVATDAAIAPAAATEPAVEALERELATLRAQWRASVHELEATNARLRASGEATIALNEELQSSQEEVQSANEELRLVNADLQHKMESLDAAHADLQHLFEATHLATVLVGPDLRIRRFSPAATEIYRIISTDVDRPLTDLAARVGPLALGDIVADVLAHDRAYQAPVRRDDDARFLMRVAPFRTLTGSLEGATITFVDITEVERAREQARERADELETMLEVLPVAVFLTRDREARQVHANREAHRVLRRWAGSTGPQNPGSSGIPLRSGGRALVRDEFPIVRAARGETLRDALMETEHADGSTIHLLGNADPLRAPDGAPRGGVAAFFDVTSLLRTEQALRVSEARLRTLGETAVDFITRFDRDLRLVYANPAVERAVGRSQDELLGRRVEEVGGLPDWNDHLRAVLASGQPNRFTYRASSERIYDVQFSPERDGEQVVSVVSVARDITEAEQSRRALQQSEARYAAMLGAAPFPMTMSHRDGRLVAVNPAFERVFGWPAAEVVGKNALELGMATAADLRQMLDAAAGGRVRDFECERRTRDGSLRRVSLNAEPITFDGGPMLITWAVDLTERVAAEAARDRLRAELAQAQKLEAIGTLAGGIAHDFNNLLGGLLGGLSLLEPDVPASARPLLDDLTGLVKRGADLSHQLLGFARKGQHDVRALDLAATLAGTLKLFAPTRRDVVVTVELAPALPPVMMDRTQLEQVLLNLLVNAGQAMPDGGQVFIGARHAPGETMVTVTVRDTGIGMDDATRDRVFEPFFTTKEPGRGTGLGLASVYGIVTNHGGTISVDSAPGQGATFTLRLPAAAAAPVPAPRATPTAVPGRGTILLVDDEPRLVEMYGRVLERLGYRVVAATSGNEAVDQLRRHEAAIDLCILDLTMPGMSGARTFDALRALRPDLKVLLASGFDADGLARDLLRRGCAGFLQKPFSVADLSNKLRELLGG